MTREDPRQVGLVWVVTAVVVLSGIGFVMGAVTVALAWWLS